MMLYFEGYLQSIDANLDQKSCSGLSAGTKIIVMYAIFPCSFTFGTHFVWQWLLNCTNSGKFSYRKTDIKILFRRNNERNYYRKGKRHFEDVHLQFIYYRKVQSLGFTTRECSSGIRVFKLMLSSATIHIIMKTFLSLIVLNGLNI